jgi:hypothetical protein
MHIVRDFTSIFLMWGRRFRLPTQANGCATYLLSSSMPDCIIPTHALT